MTSRHTNSLIPENATRTATRSDLLSWRPCWERDRLTGLLDQYEDEPWTALDVLSYRVLPRRLVSDADRLWVVLRPKLVEEVVLHEFACRCAERALHRAGVTDTRCWNAIRTKRRWIADEATDNELLAAWDAARYAGAATRYAACAAARYAAWDAACAAARAAARYAAWDAERDAAWDAERAWQVAELSRMLS